MRVQENMSMLHSFLIWILLEYVGCEKVIIIGAGSSGIAVASRLLDNGFTDFRILESQNRTGGRIDSVPFGDAIVDLGAQYIHGEDGNTVYELAKDVIKHADDITTVFFRTGRRKNGDDLSYSYAELSEYVEENGSNNQSFGKVFIPRYRKTILTKYPNNSDMLSYAKDFLATCEKITLNFHGAGSWFNLSSLTNFKNFGGDNLMNWNGLGYKTILDIMLKNYPNKTGYNIQNKLSLQKIVTKITMKNDNVEVKCKDGSKYDADHVVFTAPLGILKEYHRSLFDPNLSDIKIEIIENLGFDGGAMKVFIEFPEKWWGSVTNFVWVWEDEDTLEVMVDIPYGPRKNGTHWLNWFVQTFPTAKNPKVLIAWFVGPLVPEIEKLSNDQIKNGVYYVLRKFLRKDFNVSMPTRVLCSKWNANPSIQGILSYETPKSRTMNISSVQEVLREPIRDKNGVPRILFAGEATHSTRYGTVDGAIASGFREGDRLLTII